MASSPLPKTFLPFAWHFIRKRWKRLSLIQFFGFGWAFEHTLWPLIVMTLINTISGITSEQTRTWSLLIYPIFFGITLYVVIDIFFRISGILAARTLPEIEADIRMSMFDRVLLHSHIYFNDQLAGSIANKISDMPQSFTRMLQLIISLFMPTIVAILLSMIFFSFINPFFALILFSWVVVHASICLYFSSSCDEAANVHAETRSTLTGKIVDSLTNNSNVRFFARSNYERRYIQQFQEVEVKTHQASLWVIEKMKIFMGIACFFGSLLALNGFILYNWVKGALSTGEVIFIFSTNTNITMMSWYSGLELPNFFKEIGVCRQALTIIQAEHDITDAPDAKPLVVSKGEVVFEHVYFNYGIGDTLFQHLSIVIPAHQKVGLVGFSGSGKSTFVDLILRDYDLVAGHILIDEQNIAKVTQQSLREQISIIPQDPMLFHRTLMENIRYGRLDATDEEVFDASEKAHCHEFIMQMPEGYDAFVGERGLKLSGGQRQRIAIARAILKKAPILILDEATSALDSVTEKEIQEGMGMVMQSCTTLIVAHRLSTLAGMDRILVFHEGKIIEDGKHEELLKQNGHYTELWSMQAGGFIPH